MRQNRSCPRGRSRTLKLKYGTMSTVTRTPHFPTPTHLRSQPAYTSTYGRSLLSQQLFWSPWFMFECTSASEDTGNTWKRESRIHPVCPVHISCVCLAPCTPFSCCPATDRTCSDLTLMHTRSFPLDSTGTRKTEFRTRKTSDPSPPA